MVASRPKQAMARLQQAAIFVMECLSLLAVSVLLCAQAAWQGVVGRPRKPLKGEMVLVTGAARGLGRALALEFARKKALVVIWDIDEKGLAAVKSEIEVEGGICHAYRCDVTDIDDVNRVGIRVQNEVGDVTIVVNNAGVLQNHLFTELDVARIRRTIEVNKFFLPRMMKMRKGHIVAISSAGGICGWRYLADYSATKFGIVGMMEVLEEEMRYLGLEEVIHFTTVCPVTMDTGMNQTPTSKYPFLCPIMDVQESVQTIIEAIEGNERILTIPRKLLFPLLLAKVFPRKISLMVNEFLQYNSKPNSPDYWNRTEEKDSNKSL